MVVNFIDALKFEDLVSEFPLLPIEDDDSYRTAISILDRLFLRDDRRTPAEIRYFRALAQIAFEYELEHEFSRFSVV